MKNQQLKIPFPDYPAQRFRKPALKTLMEPDPLYKVSLIELSYTSKVKPCDMPVIKSSQDVYDAILPTFPLDKIELQEFFKCMYLDKANKVKAVYNMASGGVDSVVADIKLAAAAAMLVNASSAIFIHNHPTSKMMFSNADDMLTQKGVDIFSIHGMTLLDHMIIGKPPIYLSMAESKGMPSPRIH